MRLRSQTLFVVAALTLSYTAGSQVAENSAATLLSASNKTELAPEVAKDTDSTPASETESTLDLSIEAQTGDQSGWSVAGDLRPIFAYVEVEDYKGEAFSHGDL
jgi:hypothetical protein